MQIDGIINIIMTLKVQYYKKAVLVTGAFDVKDELKSLGGKYVGKLQGWVFSKKKRDAVISRLQSLQGVDVVDETADTAGRSGSADRQKEVSLEGADEKKKQVRKTDAKQHTRRRKLEREKEKKCRRCKTKKNHVCFGCNHKFCGECEDHVCFSCNHKFCGECEDSLTAQCPFCEEVFCLKCDDLSGIGCPQCQEAALMFGFV